MSGNKTVYELALEKGHSHAWEEDWQRAAEEYRRAAEEFPEDPQTHRAMGWVLFRAGRLREALSAYRQVVELQPQDLAAQRRLVEIYLGLGRTREAQEALLSLAELLKEGGDETGLLEALQQAVRLDPSNRLALERLAQEYIAQGDPREGASRYVRLAQLLQEDGEIQRAMEFVRQAIQLDRENEEARQLLLRLSQVESTISPTEEMGLAGPPGPATEGLAALQSRIRELIRQEESSWLEAPGERLPEVISLRQALDLQREGKLSEALRQYAQALSGSLALEEIEIARGFLYARMGDCAQAKELLARHADSEYAPAINHALGECFLGKSGPQEALPYLLDALKLLELGFASPAQVPLLRLSYEVLQREYHESRGGRMVRRMAYRLSGLMGSEDWESVISGMRRHLDALAATGIAIPIAEVLELPRDEEFMATLAQILAALEKLEYFTALEEVHRAVEIWGDYLPLHALSAEILAQGGRIGEAVEKYVNIARAYQFRSDNERARAAYARAMALAPQEVGIQRKLLDLLAEQGNMEEALEGYLNLGQTYEQLGRSDDALRAYREGLELANETTDSVKWRAKFLHRLADLQNQLGAWRDALALYSEVKQLAPQNEEARGALVSLHLQLGDPDAARKELDEILDHYEKREEMGQAAELLQRLLDAHPETDEIGMALRERLAAAYIRLGMASRAVPILDALGGMQLDAGRRDKARETIERIIALEPENVEEYRKLLTELSRDEEQR
ncbi:MAG: tetratricopeptide repeat protein [Chloroflexi bacterium]|nr:tetratricopeptide repeat protein [Chloroflexota bacterium]